MRTAGYLKPAEIPLKIVGMKPLSERDEN